MKGSSAIFIASDILLALLPILFIYKIQRPLREKVIIVILMSLGLLASGAAIAKVIILARIPKSSDPMWLGADAFLWTNLEESIGMMAACIPMLKSLFERVLKRYGLVTVTDEYGSRSKRTGSNGDSHLTTMPKSLRFSGGYERQDQSPPSTCVANSSNEAIKSREFHVSEKEIELQNIGTI
jgi:hypothetical protein